MSADPPRLRDDAESPPGLRDLLRHGAPPPALDATTKAASAAAVATLAGGSVAAASAATAAGVAGAKLWLVVGGLAIVGVVGAGVVVGVTESPRSTAPPVETTAAETAPAEPPAPPPPVAEPARPTLEPASEPAEEPSDIVVAEPAAPAPTRPRRARATPQGGAGGLVAEATMLEEARRLLASDPGAALAVTERHRREHPRAQLTAERELIAIDALRRLGRHARARRRAQRLIRRAPSGIYAERARSILADLPQ